jgi:hypothetical protein
MKRFDLHIIAYKYIPFGIGRTRKMPYVKKIKVYAESEIEAVALLSSQGYDVVKRKEERE